MDTGLRRYDEYVCRVIFVGVTREYGISRLVSCHSRAGGNRAWVVNNYLILGIIQRCVLVIYL